MELPQLPTDNLYKFMALSGIILVAISLLPFLHAHELRLEIIRLEGDVSILRQQVDWTIIDMNELQHESQSLKQRVEKLKERALERDSATTTEKSASEIREEVEEIGEDLQDTVDERLKIEYRLAEIGEINQKYAIANLQLETRNKELKYLNAELSREFYVGMCFCGCGIFMSYMGFRLWYKKLQVWQDRIIQMKAKEVQTIGNKPKE